MNKLHLPSPDLTAWAARQLELDAGSTTSNIRQSALKKLAECEFVPARAMRPALQALLHPNEPLSAPARTVPWSEESERCSAEVESFAARFLEMPPESRKRRWEELTERCAFLPPLRRRLRSLEQLLNVIVDCGDSASDQCKRLASDVAAALVKPRYQRSQEWRELVTHWNDQPNSLYPIIAELRQRNPELAAAGDDLLRSIRKNRVDPADVFFSVTSPGFAKSDVIVSPLPGPARTRRVEASSTGTFGKRATRPGVLIGGIVLAVMVLTRIFSAYSSVSHSSLRHEYEQPVQPDRVIKYRREPVTDPDNQRRRLEEQLRELMKKKQELPGMPGLPEPEKDPPGPAQFPDPRPIKPK